ncbi:hypothetical protein [Spirosoma daeguense]
MNRLTKWHTDLTTLDKARFMRVMIQKDTKYGELTMTTGKVQCLISLN